jgi:hypothetical protein
MKLVTTEDVDNYLNADRTGRVLAQVSQVGDEALTCQDWLCKSATKRYIFDTLYGDLFSQSVPRSVMDIGGGLTALTRYFATHHAYTLVDILAHDKDETANAMVRAAARDFMIREDWYVVDTGPVGIVIANDILPNVDQRLELFLDHWVLRAAEIRLSLTFYNAPRYYFTKRLDGDEVLCFLAWTGDQIRRVLARFADRIVGYDDSIFDAPPPSCYPNGRQVCLVRIVGSGAP